MLSHWLKNTMLSLSRTQCDLCHLESDDQLWCRYCQRYFLPQPRCLRCGLPTPIEVEQCGHCLTNPPLWHRLYCIGDYQQPLSRYVHRLKYQRQFWLAPLLSQRLAARIDHLAPLVTSVPMHWQRQWWRGFNQSELLAAHLAHHWQQSDYRPLFKRVRATAQQQGLNKIERQRNLRRAFMLNQVPKQTHVAIVDDVVTTGSTMRQLCALLLNAGVETIDIYCLCRTPEPND